MRKILILIVFLMNILTMDTFRFQKYAAKNTMYEQPKIRYYLPKRDEEIEYWMQ